ncbi:fatty acyl-CoA reductase 1-like, partial [Diaphorina citri]|uniref:Fatty acyl-CoA reductase n=1 Tax=Diaphorina citri TaxID=121845 RepID=A0A3Q0JIW2_DIACI
FQADNSCLPVYNYVSSTTNPITWSEFETKGYQATVRYPYSRMLYSPFVYNSPNPVVYALRTLIVHYLIFERLHLEVPDFKSKIHVLPCNLELRDLGLSPENKQMLISRVNIVLHGAATLRFDEDLQVAIQTNVRGTREVLNLAKQCPNLKMLTYVSTAFSHARSQIGEVVYEPKTH